MQLPLPIAPRDLNEQVLAPALALLPARMDSRDARVMLIAMALQESNLRARVQHPLRAGMSPGPARGLWQFERPGGVAGVLRHDATSRIAHELCAHFGLLSTSHAVWGALAENDVLAACFARLLLWTDAAPLPTTEAAGWQAYLRTWRPGKPHAIRWPNNYRIAQGAVDA